VKRIKRPIPKNPVKTHGHYENQNRKTQNTIFIMAMGLEGFQNAKI